MTDTELIEEKDRVITELVTLIFSKANEFGLQQEINDMMSMGDNIDRCKKLMNLIKPK